MVEAGANEVSEELMLKAILFAHDEIKKIVAFIDGIQAEIGKEKAEVPLVVTGDDVKAAVREYAYDKCCWVFEAYDRHERQDREAQVKAECAEHFAEQFEKGFRPACQLYLISPPAIDETFVDQLAQAFDLVANLVEVRS